MGMTSLFGAVHIKDALTVVMSSLDSLFTSDEERDQARQVLTKIQQQPALQQVELNKIEAKHRSIFVAGWRPFIGWVCGAGLAFTFLINPVMQWYTSTPGPAIPTDIMLELVIAMLGLGGLRTYEKLKGLTR